MKFPKTLKIGAHKYTIKYPHAFKERGDARGVSATYEGIIMIEDNKDGTYMKSRLIETLLHERS
jgi:hypothetical protein